jgi:hypothetical protein
MLMERVHYTHQNPVRLGLVDRAEDYKWSSVRCWNNTMREDEPLLMDIGKIEWRQGAFGGIAARDCRIGGKAKPFRTALRQSRMRILVLCQWSALRFLAPLWLLR